MTKEMQMKREEIEAARAILDRLVLTESADKVLEQSQKVDKLIEDYMDMSGQ